ncbi:hypothetical protein ES689_08130 [Frigoribacterium sp. ACAM 257]|uniref:hypothetical protein n=1 Tax=Frigoribacterium sp. ACAM 257 TaxID=2508998 RepID=UPI0011B9D5F9|nr:hypothetical protein [Frigoribacterium sp. ACAM 257]TWX38583.1 hypothetical protein ES689_08130 [Frigoribacterium sp. ACAM 257]
MTFGIDYDPRWVPVLGLDPGRIDGAPPPPLPAGSDRTRELMLTEGAAAGFVLADAAEPAAALVSWATVHVEDVPGCTVEAVVEGFRVVPSAVSATTVDRVETRLGRAVRLQHDRVHHLRVDGAGSLGSVLLTHVIWLWQIVDDGDQVVVSLGTETPAPHPAAEVLPLFDDLARGFGPRPDLA